MPRDIRNKPRITSKHGEKLAVGVEPTNSSPKHVLPLNYASGCPTGISPGQMIAEIPVHRMRHPINAQGMHRRLSEPLLRAGLEKGGTGKAEKKTFPVWGAAVWIAHNGREARRGERGHPLYIQFIIDSRVLQHGLLYVLIDVRCFVIKF